MNEPLTMARQKSSGKRRFGHLTGNSSLAYPRTQLDPARIPLKRAGYTDQIQSTDLQNNCIGICPPIQNNINIKIKNKNNNNQGGHNPMQKGDQLTEPVKRPCTFSGVSRVPITFVKTKASATACRPFPCSSRFLRSRTYVN